MPQDTPTGPVRQVNLGPASTRTGRRRELDRLLSPQDPEAARELLPQVLATDVPMLRTIAQESDASGTAPYIRQNAMLILARFPTPENLSLLRELSASGSRDLYTRAAATVALAATEREDAIAAVADRLTATDPVEAAYARAGLRTLASALGESTVRTALASDSRGAVQALLAAGFGTNIGSGSPAGDALA